MGRYSRVLTISKVLELAGQDGTLYRYLPDEPRNHVTQAFLYTIVNTIDPSFFPNSEV